MSYDAHDYERRIERLLTLINESEDITSQNKKDIARFKTEGLAEGLSYGRIARYLSDLKLLARWLGKDFRDTSEAELKELVIRIQQSTYKPSYKRDLKITLRKLYKFLRNSLVVPPELQWMKVENKSNVKRLPDEMFTEEDIRALLNAANNPRDKALIAVLYETGCRVGELLSIRIKHVRFDELGGFLMVTGKTGPRRVRVVSCVPYLTKWLNEHPFKNQPECPLWVRRNAPLPKPLPYGAVSVVLRKLGKSAGISKPLNPHNFRHSRATYLANHLTESQMKEYLGWVQASKMAAIYVHLSGRDIDYAILKTYGLQVKNNGKQESILRPLSCERCAESNPPTNKYCLRCGFPLDEQERLRLLDSNMRRSEADRLMDILIKDDEFRIILERKIRELRP